MFPLPPDTLRSLVAQVILSVATCGLLFVIAKPVFGRRAALSGALLFALSPSVIVHTARPMSETLYLFLIALAALAALRLYRSVRLLTALGFGLAWGAAGLTRPEAALVLAPLVLPTVTTGRFQIGKRLSVCSVAFLAGLVVAAPWVVRNYQVYGAFVPSVPMGGLQFFAGTYPHAPRFPAQAGTPGPVPITQTPEYCEITGPYWDPEYRPDSPARASHEARDRVEGMPASTPDLSIVVVRNEGDLLEIDRKLAAAAWANIKNHPLTQLYNSPKHLFLLWSSPSAIWAIDDESHPRLLIGWKRLYLGLLALFVLGVVVAWKNNRLGAIPLSWLAVVAANTVAFLVLHAEPRHQISSTIFLFVFSGLGVAAILTRAFPDRVHQNRRQFQDADDVVLAGVGSRPVTPDPLGHPPRDSA